jgi:hypothetical protein
MNIRTKGGDNERSNETRCARVDPADEKKGIVFEFEF